MIKKLNTCSFIPILLTDNDVISSNYEKVSKFLNAFCKSFTADKGINGARYQKTVIEILRTSIS